MSTESTPLSPPVHNPSTQSGAAGGAIGERAQLSAQHSKGPWRIDWNHASGGVHPDLPHLHYAAIISSDEALHIAGYVRKSDFHLIAAAPDLLALARKLAGECAGCGGSAETIQSNGPAPEDEYSLPCEDCADIRAVIDKATKGVTP